MNPWHRRSGGKRRKTGRHAPAAVAPARRCALIGMRVSAPVGGLLFAALLLLPTGCDDDHDCVCPGPDVDVIAPAAPRGLYSITGDNRVTLVWLANTEPDLDGYELWWSTAYDGEYQHIATWSPSGEYYEQYDDYEAINGETYYYAVSAVDLTGNESELSLEEVWDTPRPEGMSLVHNALTEPSAAGFDFAAGPIYGRVVPAGSPEADFRFEFETIVGVGSRASLVSARPSLVLIQDMGNAGSFEEIGYSPGPGEGWSAAGRVEAIEGHIYTFRILEGPLGFHAKIWLTEVGPGGITFQWAYQTQPGNQQLSVP